MRSLQDRHSALVDMQAASLTEHLELTSLRSELARSRGEAGKLADKLAAAQETCRQLALSASSVLYGTFLQHMCIRVSSLYEDFWDDTPVCVYMLCSNYCPSHVPVPVLFSYCEYRSMNKMHLMLCIQKQLPVMLLQQLHQRSVACRRHTTFAMMKPCWHTHLLL